MQNLSFLHSLEVAQKFVVEEPKIIWWGAKDYLVSKVILVFTFGPRPKLNNKSSLKEKNVSFQDLEVWISQKGWDMVQIAI